MLYGPTYFSFDFGSSIITVINIGHHTTTKSIKELVALPAKLGFYCPTPRDSALKLHRLVHCPLTPKNNHSEGGISAETEASDALT